MNDEAVLDLARRAGIAVEWKDYAGRPHSVAPDVLQRILEALGLPCSTRGDLVASRKQVGHKSSITSLPPLITATAGRPTRLEVGGNDLQPACVLLESGREMDITLTPVRGRLRLPAINETGYHRLAIGNREIVLAVAPSRCRMIEDIVPDGRLWGIAAQVYSLRHQGDGGIGDAAGVASLAEAAGARGADVLALSPLHALFSADPSRFGPYSPSTRLFLNPLHASPALVLGQERVAQILVDAGLVDTFARLAKARLIDWPQAARAKLDLLRHLYGAFAEDADIALRADFAQFCADGGDRLTQHAVFETLHAAQFASGSGDWRKWPLDLRNPASPAVAVFAASHEDEVRFHRFLQWLADRSLAAAQERAGQAGMRIGLVADLAVGMDPAGSHAWSHQREMLGGLAIGAPPDLFNPRGQNWGLTNFSPRALVNDGFAPFLATVRAAMRHSGGLRIDHAMGMTRLWLIPDGAEPDQGAYLSYPLTDLLHLLALESQRRGAVVVGEDLGTVPAGFREALENAGLHGMRVVWFERSDRGFLRPEAWDATAVAMPSTHDLPTIAGWWQGSDITTRAACNRLGAGVKEADLIEERVGDRRALWRAFVDAGVAAGPQPSLETAQPVVGATLAFIASTPSPLVLPSVEDVLGLEEQPNLPGTLEEYPNWRRRLAPEAHALLDEPRAAERVAMMEQKRPRL
jgi:4-alpha-glucanotransferase